MSLAADQIRFDGPSRYHGPFSKAQSRGYHTADDEPRLMPLFGSGCHAEGQEPGSSPSESIYWFEGVPISLVPDTVFENDTDAAIAKAVEHGLATGRSDFRMVLFSIWRAVLVEISTKDAVHKIPRTGLVRICDRRENGDRSGFAALQTFFATAADRALRVSTEGVFPPDIYGLILEHADLETRRSCARVSRTFQTLSRNPFTKFSTTFIGGMDVSAAHLRKLTEKSVVSNWEAMYYIEEGKTAGIWFPILGQGSRLSMMTQAAIRLVP
ncbi:uncharacterized protein PV07_12574 [Cladophialophora immunda]|uniref:F-box domain-containing protein n=1 Tax=Cladophialophora immunda TaxID=569365 RepID=A0A0D2CET5_9EURO|nr:uncharacterized protein PV07_12574 [Cladophialophora immunda]KIW22034.1 hypothetical protein PV07_12574 [Cladophialophora immunda]